MVCTDSPSRMIVNRIKVYNVYNYNVHNVVGTLVQWEINRRSIACCTLFVELSGGVVGAGHTVAMFGGSGFETAFHDRCDSAG